MNQQLIKSKKRRIIKIFGKNKLDPIKINIPSDPSSAAFFSGIFGVVALNQEMRIC